MGNLRALSHFKMTSLKRTLDISCNITLLGQTNACCINKRHQLQSKKCFRLAQHNQKFSHSSTFAASKQNPEQLWLGAPPFKRNKHVVKKSLVFPVKNYASNMSLYRWSPDCCCSFFTKFDLRAMWNQLIYSETCLGAD